MNTETRYRSHHDSQAALKKALGIERKGRPGGSPTGSPTMDELLDVTPASSPRGLYLHVPYCDTICTFCTMNRRHATSDALSHYAGDLQSQIDAASVSPYVADGDFDALYFGGGTPTALPSGELAVVLSSIAAGIPRSDSCEWTVETTLHNLSDEKLELMQQAGVNRLSIGIQTFSDRGRKILGRSGGSAWAVEQLERVRRRFSGTVGIDLIYSYPDQSRDEVRTDAEWVRRLDIDSVSMYSLMIHDGSRLARQLGDGELSFTRSIESDRVRHNLLYELLSQAGFELLELTKMVKPRRDEYRYIKIRYDNRDLLPIGNGAGGRIGAHRVYRMLPGQIMVSLIDPRYDAYNRVLGYLQYGLYDLESLAGLCGEASREPLETLLERLESEGYLRSVGDSRRRLTPDGVFWGNNLAVAVLEHVIDAVGVHTESAANV